ncbi:MAG TPA: hypothetical protein VFG89_04010 [Coriobacteriia bacterium]|nr:hypothetical protein [Coriobacteriia bacterium]
MASEPTTDVTGAAGAPARSATPTPSAILSAAAALIVVVGLALVVLGSSPAVCATCHGAQAKALTMTVHKRIDCYACHLDTGWWSLAEQKGAEVFRMYPAAMMGRRPSGPVHQTAANRCLKCHQQVLSSMSSGTRIRLVHKQCAKDDSCDPCHVSTAHRKAVRWKTGAVMEACTSCHARKDVSVRCATCHVVTSNARGEYRSPWRVTHSKNWRRTHGMGDLYSCSICHEQGFCAKCHGMDVPHSADFGGQHGAIALANPIACKRCHKGERLCVGCHQIEMPHPAGFAAKHKTIAEGTVDPRCFRCHVENDCDKCHEMHVHPGGSKGVPVPWTLTNPQFRSKDSK